MPDIVKHLETGTCAVALGVLCGVKTQVRWRWLLGLRSSQGSHFTEQQGKSQGRSALWISQHQGGPCHMVPSSRGRCRHPTGQKEVREAEMKEERKEITEGKRL